MWWRRLRYLLLLVAPIIIVVVFSFGDPVRGGGNAGGFTTAAKHSEVYLFRRVSDQWVSSQKLDVKQMLKSGNLAEDLQLQPGDMLYVPKNTVSKVLYLQPLIPYNLFRLNFGPF